MTKNTRNPKVLIEIEANLSVSKEHMNVVVGGCIDTIRLAGRVSEFIESIGVTFAHLNNITGPIFRIHFEVAGEQLWIQTDFRFIGEGVNFPSSPTIVANHLVEIIQREMPRILEMEQKDIRDELMHLEEVMKLVTPSSSS